VRRTLLVLLLAGGCVYRVEVDWDPGSPLSVVEFGPLGAHNVIEFEIPSDARGFVLALENDRGRTVELAELEDPKGRMYVEESLPKLLDRPMWAEGTVSLAVPFGDALLPIQPAYGEWRATHAGADRGELWVRRGAFHGGELDLVLHARPGADDPGYVTALLDRAFPLGAIEVGAIEVLSLPAGIELRSAADLEDLLASGEHDDFPSIDVFLVDAIDIGPWVGGGFAAFAGLPRSGTPLSGVAVQWTGDGTRDGGTLAHELGHFSGLAHTTDSELGGDAILDTPVCPDDVLAEARSDCPDADNAMFPWGGRDWSPVQSEILERGVAYRALP
jgi:hypothetical protein